MTSRTTQNGLFGLVFLFTCSFLAGVLATPAAVADDDEKGATTQPAKKSPASQEALRKLLEMKEEFERQKAREQDAGQKDAGAAKAKTPRRSTGRPLPKKATPPTGPDDQEDARRQRLEDLKRRAMQRQQRGRDEMVGPPEILSNDMQRQRKEGVAEIEARVPERPEPRSDQDQPRRKREVIPEDEGYTWFQYVDMPWEQVVEDFAERIGKPIMNQDDLVITGTLTYESEQKFTKKEAIDELNFLLHEHPIGFRFVERPEHIRVVELVDMPQYVPLEHVYASVEEFEEDDPRNMEFVTVYYRVKDAPAQKLVDAFADALPLYARISALDESNQIKLVALAKDVRKFLTLKDKIDLSPSDPRELRIFDIKTNARTIEQLLREFLNLSDSRGRIQMVRDPKTRRMVPKRVGGGGDEANVQMVADERTNSIIVKATSDQVEEITKLIEEFDKKPDIGEFKTQVIEIQHADAGEVANLLNQIFQQEQSEAGSSNLQRLRALQRARSRAARSRRTRRTPARTAQAQGATPEDIHSEGIYERARKTIRLVADERMNALIVYANEEGFARVKEMLEVLDKPLTDNFQTVAVEHAEVADIHPMLMQLVSSLVEGGPRRGLATGPSIVPDESQNVFYVIAERDEMERIKSLIAQLDIPGPEEIRHVVKLENLLPSQVASMVETLLESDTGTSSPRRMPRRRGRGRISLPGLSATGGPNYQIIPLDEAQTLIVVCAEEDWQRVEETINLWDSNALTNTPRMEVYPVEHGDAQSIAMTLSTFYRSYSHPAFPRSSVGIQADGDKIFVYAIRPAHEEISALIETLDIESPEDKPIILPLAHADANTVAQRCQELFGGGVTRRGRRVTQTGPTIIAETVTNSLIVQANQAELDKITDLAQRMDEQVAAQAPERKYFTLRYAQPREVVSAVSQLYTGGGGGRSFRGRPVGSQVKVVTSGPQVVVEAPKDKMPKITATIEQLDDPKGNEIVIKTITLPGADVNQIARKLSTSFRQRRNVTAIFDADSSSETIVVTCQKDALPEAEKLIKELADAYKPLVSTTEFVQLQRSPANEAAGWLRSQLVTYIEKQFGRSAARQLQVTAQQSTNRVIINGPQVAVEHGKQLLKQYDEDIVSNFSPPIRTETRKLPGLDVGDLARSLDRTFREETRQRPDRLRAVFQADELTQTLIISAPEDMYERIDKVIKEFEAEVANVEPSQEFIEIKEADANYVAGQVRNLLTQHVTQRRGRRAAREINIGVDTRLNRITVSGPKFAIEKARELVTQLDKPSIEQSQLQTISLENADANAVYSVLRQIFNEKIRAGTLQISVERMTNSLIVGGNDEDFAQIEKWAQELDEQAIQKRGKLEIVELMNANPWEVRNILNTQYQSRGRGRRNRLGEDIRFDVVGGRSIVAQAPEDKMPEVLELIAKLDDSDVDKVEVRIYELPGVGRGIRDLAREVTRAMNQTVEQRERRVTITPYESADTLIVTARTDQFPEIDAFLDKFKGLVEKETTVAKFIELEHLDAQRYAGQIQNMLANKLAKEGRRSSRHMQNLSITPDPRTNRLICYVPEKIVPDLEEVVQFLDIPPTIKEGELRTIELAYADAGTVANILRPMFEQTRRQRRQQDFSQIEVRIQPELITNSLIVTASDEDFEQIRQKAIEIDEGAIVRKADPELIKVQYADPHALSSIITQSLRESGTGWGRRFAEEEEVSVQVLGSNLLVQAPKDKLEEAKALIAKLDVVDTEDQPIIIEPEYADVHQLSQTINAMFATRSRGRQQDVQVTVANGQLVVRAPKQKLDQIQALVAEIDSEDREALQIRTYQLKLLNATQVAAQVQGYLRGLVNNQRRGQMQPGAFAEPSTNTLVVIAPEKHLPFIEGLVTKLESSDRRDSEARAYVLKHVRAEQVAQSVDQMLKAKVTEREGAVRSRSAQLQTMVVSDQASNRLFVYAPEEYQELATELIRMVDEDVDTGELVHIIPLENADATELVQSLQNVIAGGGRRGHRGGGGMQVDVRLSADPGSNSILVAGLPQDVAEIEKWITELEGNSVRIPEVQIFQLQYANTLDVADMLRDLFGDSGRGRARGRSPQDQVTITEDEYYSRLIVTANKRKMRQVEAYIQELDQAPDLPEEGFGIGDRQIYFVDVNRGSPWEIALDVSSMFPPEDRGGPSIESDWFDEYLIVKCRTAEFPRVLKAIREFERRAKSDLVVKQYRPKGNIDQLIRFLKVREEGSNVVIERASDQPTYETMVEELWPADETPPWKRERDQAKPETGGRRVVPFRTGISLTEVMLDDFEEDLFGDTSSEPAAEPAQETAPAPEDDRQSPPKRNTTASDSRPQDRETSPAASDQEEQPEYTPGQTVESPIEQEPTRIVVQEDGTVVLYGDREEVEDVTEVFSLLEEDMAEGEVIRIFRFRYGDVSAAAEVLNIMFNDRQRVIARPQPQRRQQGRGDQDDRQQGPMDQINRMIGRRSRDTGGQRMRIATDPAHNYLIVKCNAADLPEIRKLLRELDIPPGEVQVKIFQLKNLVAEETAQDIKDVLGISQVQQRRGRGAPQSRRGRRGSRQQELIEMLQQQSVSVPGVEGGAKVEQVEIVPNVVTNSLMVSAPVEVMGLIEDVITRLEKLEGYDVVGVHHYQLEHARLDDILPLLDELFEAAGSGGGRGGRRGGGSSPAQMGPVTVSGDPRTNTIIFTAENKDADKVIEQIKRLDDPNAGAIAEAEMYICQWGDAEAIAGMVEAIYVTGGGQRGRRGRGPQTGSVTENVRVVADPNTNTILVYGPLDKRDLIFSKIEELDRLSERAIREIDVTYADPEELAATLMGMFSNDGATTVSRSRHGRGRGSQPGGGVMSSGRITILGDKDAQKLLVRAPDHVFEQIQSLVATLDQPDKTMQLRRFQLQYADAQSVVTSVSQAMGDYLQQAQRAGDDVDLDAFSAVPDPRTNAIVVVGSEEVFMFVQQILSQIDIETPEDQRKEFRIFALEKADATTVADAINSYATGSDAGSGGRRGRGRGGAPGTPRELNVHAVAEDQTNSVMVFGRIEDIQHVELAVIEQLEQSLADRFQIAEIEVEQVRPSEIVSFIWQFLDQGTPNEGGGRGRRGRGNAGDTTAGPRVVPNDADMKLVVRGTPGQIEEIRHLAARFDDPSLITNTIRIIPIPRGQDAMALANEVEALINDSEERLADITGRQARPVVIRGEDYTNTLIVAGDPSMFGMVETLVGQLKEVGPGQMVTRVIQLDNISAEDAQQMISDLQEQRGSSSSGRRSPVRRRPSRGGRRGALWPSQQSPPGLHDQPIIGAPIPWAMPLVGTGSPHASLMYGARLIEHLFDTDDDPPATQETSENQSAAERRKALENEIYAELTAEDPPTEPADQPQKRRPAERKPRAPRNQQRRNAPAQQPPAQSATAPDSIGEIIAGIGGTLEGQVSASVLDSRRIVVTGSEEDVAFIQQILLMMEASAPRPVIEIFSLASAKASTLQPIVEETMESLIDAKTASPGPTDRFSIIAETGSNALIASASEENMAIISDIIAELDVERPGEGTDFKTVVLQNMRASEAVTVLRPTVEKLNEMRDVPNEAQASIRAIDRNNSIMIVGTKKDVEEITRLIETVDVELTDEERESSFVRADMILIPLKNAQAEDVAEVLMEMIEEQQQAARDAEGERAGEPFVKVLQLRLLDGRELPELNLDRPIKILPEPGTNALIVFSTPSNNEALVELVNVFDTLPIGADTDVKAFALEHAAAEQVAELLQETFDNKRYLRRPSEGDSDSLDEGELPPIPPGVAAKGLPYPVLVQHDPRTNTVIVIGRKDAVLLAGGLIGELDRPSTHLGLQAHVLAVEEQPVTELAEKLNDLLEERVNVLGSENEARDSAIIEPDERSNSLIVIASDEMHTMVRDLVSQLDVSETYSMVDIRYHPVEHADPVKLKNLLEQTFEARADAEQETNDASFDSFHVIADSRDRALIMTGTRGFLSEAEQLVRQLDRPGQNAVEMRVRQVKLNSAQNIATLLEELIDKSLKEEDSALSGIPITIKADPLSESLLIAASRPDQDIIERWVETLDRPPQVGRMTRIIPLARAIAEDVANVVDDVFKGRSGDAGDIDLTVTHDEKTNSIVVHGPPGLLADIADFIHQLDNTEVTGGTIVRLFKLDQADAEDAGELLERILEGRGGAVGAGGGGGGGTREDAANQVMLIYQQEHPELGRETLRGMRSEVVVISDIRTNSLVIEAPPDTMPLMESLVQAIDLPPDAARIRVFRLQNADAEQLAEMLDELFERRAAGRTGGGTDESERVLALGETMGGRQEIAFTTDVRTNSVIAAGTPGYLDLVEEMILELDTIPMDDRRVFVYPPRNITAETLAQSLRDYSESEQDLLQEIDDEVSLSRRQEREVIAIANEDANRVIVGVDPRFENSVMNVIHELDQPPPQVMIKVLIIEVNMDNELDLGVEFAFQDLQYAKAGPTDTTTFDYVGGTDVGAAGSGLGGFVFTITGADFNFLFRTLQSEGNLRVLSRPQIVAMDNQEALINISDSVPYVTGTQTSTTGQISTSVSREDVGIKLEVTPQINPDGFVRMEIRQEVSDQTGSSVDVGPGVTAPIFFTRETETTVTVKDNETVVLGGLITSRVENREQKVPILGDIPGLGWLFRNQSDTTRRTELLVVLTPQVIRTVDDYRMASVTERDRIRIIAPEVLSDELMENLRLEPSPLPDKENGNGRSAPIPRETPRRDDRPESEMYGPLRPALRPDKPPIIDPDSYVVPLTYRSPRNHLRN